MSNYQALKGMKDILPGEVELWQRLESQARHFFEAYGFDEIRTPLLESTELFARTIGEGSDIVHKQMYTFSDRGERSITLRPEMTASVVRAAVENGLLRANKTSRLYYMGPMFRAERPQRGRQRQFHQLGAEILNAQKVDADVEIVACLDGLLRFLGIADFKIYHNYLGSESDRAAYTAVLKDYFSKAKAALCEDCHYRIEKNVLRVLDCKVPECQGVIRGAPALKLGKDSTAEYDRIRQELAGRNITAEHSPRLVRGLDYYTGLVFEAVGGGELGSQDAVAAGGRYDGLISSLGGPAMSATGFAAGLERILLARKGSAVETGADEVYVATLDTQPATEHYFEQVFRKLYQLGRRVRRDPHLHALGDHFKKAEKFGLQWMIIIGDNEVRQQTLTLKNLKARSQEQLPFDRLPAVLSEKLCGK